VKSHFRLETAILTGIVMMFLLIAAGGIITSAYAQYFGNTDTSGKTGKNTLEETLKLATERVENAKNNPHTGSGTPYLAADGVLGASAIAGAVFGGIAAAFFIRGKHGRYAAVGRG
jgi:hypothetical protein